MMEAPGYGWGPSSLKLNGYRSRTGRRPCTCRTYSGTGGTVVARKSKAEREFEELVAQILELTGPVVERFSLLVEAGVDMRALLDAREAARAAAEAWARRLLNREDDTAPAAARNLMMAAFGERPPWEFWKTPLGQLIIAREAFPESPITRREAQAAWGVSYKGASWLWGAHPEWRHRDAVSGEESNDFTRQAVMTEWHRRNKERQYRYMQELASAGEVDISIETLNRMIQ